MTTASLATCQLNALLKGKIESIIGKAMRLGLPEKHGERLRAYAESCLGFKIGESCRKIASCQGCHTSDPEIDGLREEVKRLKKENEQLSEENAKLKARTRKNSRNSSLPPSSDPPSAPKRVKKKPSKRKPGGQPGHNKKSRALVPTEQVDTVVSIYPENCEVCGKDLTETEKRKDPELAPGHRHQQWEIPPIKPIVTEFQCHLAECNHCKAVSRATFPESVTRSTFGPNLMALVVLLTGAYHMSKRCVASLLLSAFGVAVALGSISNIEHRVSKALRGPVGVLRRMVQLAKVVYADETTWKERAQRVYIWAAVASFGAVYIVRKSRAASIAIELLGIKEKVVVTDRYKGYLWIPVEWRQICWAHLKRDFEWIMGFPGEAGRIGKDLLANEKQLFSLWHLVKEGNLERSSFRTLVSPIRVRIRNLLRKGVALKLAGVSGMCEDMLRIYPAFYTFVRVEGVEPTNNMVEARQRLPAIWRRVSFGTWSRRGSEYVGNILSVVTTLRLQGREILPYLQEACRAALEGRDAPSLLPLDAKKSGRNAA